MIIQKDRDGGVYFDTVMDFYPPNKCGNKSLENLCTYKVNPKFIGQTHFCESVDLEFDIERHVRWDKNMQLLPFLYSMMINGYFPVNNSFYRRSSYPTKEGFVKNAARLEGFYIDDTYDIPWFRNEARNVFINWSVNKEVSCGSRRDRVCIGVIQDNPVLELRIVAEEIVPYAVFIFNKLSPTRNISDAVVERVVNIAISKNEVVTRFKNGIKQ